MNGGDEVFSFGKHKGKTFAWVYENDASYKDWAMGKGGGLKKFTDYCKTVVAPLPEEEEDLDVAALKLLKRSGLEVTLNDLERDARKRSREHRADVADARFQMTHKYRAHGYSSPQEFAANERQAMTIISSRPARVKQHAPVPEPKAADPLLEYAKLIIEVHRSPPGEVREVVGLNNATRKTIHTMAQHFPDLLVETKDRRDPKDLTKKKSYHGESIANMVIEKMFV